MARRLVDAVESSGTDIGVAIFGTIADDVIERDGADGSIVFL